jgi:hypothetical protein
MQPLSPWQARSEVEAMGSGNPLGVVLETPDVVPLEENANGASVDIYV